LVKLSDKSNNLQDQGINFSLGYKFWIAFSLTPS
jgi:hypothetical protein